MFRSHYFGADHQLHNRSPLARRRKGLAWAARAVIESLETRMLFAADITIISGAAGSGTLDHFLSATNGTITTAEDSGDTTATLSTGALTQVGSTISISINATTNIVFQDVGTVVLQTGAASSAGFTTSTGSISFNNTANTLSTSGGALFFGAGTGVTAANLSAGAGGIALTAGISTTGAVNVNAITAASVFLDSENSSINSIGSSPISTSGQLTMNAATGISVNTSAAQLQVTNQSSGNINITQVASPALTLATAGTGVVNNAPTGTINITNLGSTLTVASGSPVTSTNGTITLLGTDLTINASINSGTAHTTLSGSVAATPINLGTANVAGSVGLTQAYLNNITASALQIGSPSAGAITISAPISVGTLTLTNNGSITETSSPGVGTLTATNLTINSTGPVSLTNNTSATTLTINSTGAITVNQVTGTTVNLSSFSGSISSAAANPIGASGQLTLSAATGITVNTSAAKVQATNSSGGNINITQVASPALALATVGTGVVNSASGGTINITNLGSTVTVASGAPVTTTNGIITLLATDLTINGSVNSGTSTTTLGNSVAATPINLGTANVVGSIGLTQAYLNNVTANTLRIGTATAGAITVSQSISRSSLSLINNASITESTSPATGSLSVTNLRIASSGPVSLSNANNVTNLGASTSGAFTINNGANAITIPSAGVDGAQGIFTNNAPITVTTTGTSLTALAEVSAGTSNVTMTAVGSITVDQVQGSTVSLTSSSSAISSAGSNPIAASTLLSMNAATGISVNTSAAGLKATNSSSGNIFVTQVASPAQPLTTAGTGVINNAPGGTINITNLGSTLTVASGAPITSTNANINLLATDLTFTGLVNSGTAATTLGNSVAGYPINLGTANVSGSIGLTQASLSNVTASVLRIGSATAGAITISAPIAKTSLSLINNGSITETPGASLTVTNLRFSSTGPVSLTGPNAVANLGASTTNAFTLNNGASALNLPAAGVDGAESITTNNAVITISTSGTMTIPATVPIQNLTFAGGTLLDNGTITETLSNLSLSSITGSGTLTVTGGSTIAGRITLTTISLSGAGSLQLAPNSATSKVSTLTFAGSSTSGWTGTLDLTNNKLIVENSSTHTTALANLRNQDAYAAAHGNAGGLFATGQLTGKKMIVLDNTVEGLTNFGGTTVDPGSILLMAAFPGDANLDGVVDIQDLTALVNHWQQSTASWTKGDFDSNGIVDIQDLTALVNNWQAGVGAGGGASTSEEVTPATNPVSTTISAPVVAPPIAANTATFSSATGAASITSSSSSDFIVGSTDEPFHHFKNNWKTKRTKLKPPFCMSSHV